MFINNFDPIAFQVFSLEIRWYSLAYIFGIVIGWWLGKKIIKSVMNKTAIKFNISIFDDLITYLINYMLK